MGGDVGKTDLELYGQALSRTSHVSAHTCHFTCLFNLVSFSPSSDLRPSDEPCKDTVDSDTEGEGCDVVGKGVIVNKADVNDSVENLVNILPLLLSFLQAVITNQHSEKGSPQSAELLARIGMSVLEELIDGLSTLNCENSQVANSNFAMCSESIWAHVASCLCSINEFANHAPELMDARDARAEEDMVVRSEKESGEEDEEDGGDTIDEEDDKIVTSPIRQTRAFVIDSHVMTKFVLALKVAKMVSGYVYRFLIDPPPL